MRQRKSCCFSSSVGALKLVIRTPCGSTRPIGVAEHAALAAGVHALQHQQDAALGPDGALGPEPLLQVGELGAHRGERRLAVALLAVEAGGGVGLDRGQVDRARGQAQVGGDVVRHGHIMAHGVVPLGRGRGARRACSRPPSRSCRRAAARRTRVPRVNPALASIRSDAALRWSGAAKYDVASGNRSGRVRIHAHSIRGAEPAARPPGLPDGVVDADRRPGRARGGRVRGSRRSGSPGRTRPTGR